MADLLRLQHIKPLEGLTIEEQANLLACISSMSVFMHSSLKHTLSDTTVVPILEIQNRPDHNPELDFIRVCQSLAMLQHAKGVHYKNSYSKHGLMSIFFNLSRKYDRWENQLFHGTGDAPSESVLDTLADLAVYAVKQFAWVAARQPQAYLKWLESVEREMVAVGLPTSQIDPMAPANLHKSLLTTDD